MIKAGILGGGQLGRMLLQEAANFPVLTYIMEGDEDCPAAHLCHHFIKGDIRNYDDVLRFGEPLDVITIEIENVNVDALEALEKLGKKVIPSASVLRTIRNKRIQKEFYQQLELPSPAFVITHSAGDVRNHSSFLPAVHKVAVGGYDGKGVSVINNVDEIAKAFDGEAVLEKKINVHREIAVMVAVSQKGETALYPPVEMIFDPYLNLLDYQLSPADLLEKSLWKIEAIAIKLAKAFKSAGLFAIEMLVDANGDVWINETAPRVHNSGHHTIEANICSQYEMMWRILLDMPLASTQVLYPSALINLIGEADSSGNVRYDGLDEIMKINQAYVHLYGKAETRPGRKMGHITLLGTDRIDLIRKCKMIKDRFKVVSR